ncbi:hypothetical protein [Methylocaldum szegediense]|uniref:Uncharacterized protein n=1 Tax=Methylocaldum szegediense TaxID=73780 RepID=A0ABN8X4S0_9GAMM|nr:hypothetical protein [Methylocaldum szegediense]CAI8786530.1 protein of unknown function [Methylocaldum szegediense]
MTVNKRSVIFSIVLLMLGALTGAIVSLMWYDRYFKVPYEASSACYAEISKRLDGRVSSRYVSGGKRDYGWEHWAGLYDGPGPNFSNRTLLGVAHCKIINEYNVSTGKLEPKVAELTTSFDHLLQKSP